MLEADLANVERRPKTAGFIRRAAGFTKRERFATRSRFHFRVLLSNGFQKLGLSWSGKGLLVSHPWNSSPKNVNDPWL
jgi:hypothetical protein